MILHHAGYSKTQSGPFHQYRSQSDVSGCAARNGCVIPSLSVLTEALADLQEMLEVPTPENSCPEGVPVQGPGSGAEAVTALRFWMSGPYKISRGEAEKLAGGQHSSAREASSQEVNNNSKQSSNKRGPSDVLTLECIVHPKEPCGKYMSTCYI